MNRKQRNIEILERQVKSNEEKLERLRAAKRVRSGPFPLGQGPTEGDGGSLARHITNAENALRYSKEQLYRAKNYKPPTREDEIKAIEETLARLRDKGGARPRNRTTAVIQNYERRLSRLRGEL